MKSKIPIIYLFFIAGIVFSAAVIVFLSIGLSLQGSSARQIDFYDNQGAQNISGEDPVGSVRNIVPSGEASRPVKEAGSGLPVRFVIPKIKVDASFEYVGLTSNGEVDVPKDFTKVALFDLWPRPGESGNAIITGHYGRKNGKPSVFDNLYKLRRGDKMSVEDDKGIITVFVVREIRRYDPKADATYVFSSSDGKSHLNLITCEGTWNKASESYSKRLVIFTDKE